MHGVLDKQTVLVLFFSKLSGNFPFNIGRRQFVQISTFWLTVSLLIALYIELFTLYYVTLLPKGWSSKKGFLLFYVVHFLAIVPCTISHLICLITTVRTLSCYNKMINEIALVDRLFKALGDTSLQRKVRIEQFLLDILMFACWVVQIFMFSFRDPILGVMELLHITLSILGVWFQIYGFVVFSSELSDRFICTFQHLINMRESFRYYGKLSKLILLLSINRRLCDTCDNLQSSFSKKALCISTSLFLIITSNSFFLYWLFIHYKREVLSAIIFRISWATLSLCLVFKLTISSTDLTRKVCSFIYLK